jgi:hypothetical protein
MKQSITYLVTVNEDRTEWRKADQLHREDGPAVEYKDGSKEYWQNNQLHRTDGPALEWKDGSKSWWKNGLRHREDGPAIEWNNGVKDHYLNDEYYSKEVWEIEVAKLKAPKIPEEVLKAWKLLDNNGYKIVKK